MAAGDIELLTAVRHTRVVGDGWVDQDEFARLLGHASQRTLASWRARGIPAAHPIPPPDEVANERGHARPRWRRETVDRYLAERPGRGNGRLAR